MSFSTLTPVPHDGRMDPSQPRFGGPTRRRSFTPAQKLDHVDPVAPARRSPAADHKAATKTTTDALPARSFTSLLGPLATLTRNHLRVAGHDTSGFDLLAIPTPTGRRAFELLGAPIPLTLK